MIWWMGWRVGVYKLDAHPTPVVHHGQELDQFTIHQTEGDPGIKLSAETGRL